MPKARSVARTRGMFISNDDMEYITLCLQGVAHWTGCEAPQFPCIRCQRDQMAQRVVDLEETLAIKKKNATWVPPTSWDAMMKVKGR